jgi:hypothetical protein
MLQFDKSETTNSNAVWIQTVNTSSGYYNDLVLFIVNLMINQWYYFDLLILSAPNAYRNWLVISNSGSAVPSPSGQYDIQIWTESDVEAPTWDQVQHVGIHLTNLGHFGDQVTY